MPAPTTVYAVHTMVYVVHATVYVAPDGLCVALGGGVLMRCVCGRGEHCSS